LRGETVKEGAWPTYINSYKGGFNLNEKKERGAMEAGDPNILEKGDLLRVW